MERTLVEHIEVTPGVADGKPRIAGRRITVHNLAIWHERMGLSADKIASDYNPDLSEVYSALAYYYDHRVEIDRATRDDGALVAELRSRIPSRSVSRLQ